MIGSVLGNYRIRLEIGRGGMGAVYVADHIHLSRQVALKVLLPELCNDPESVRRLFQEARATSLISHPGILEIFDCAAPRPDLAYIVMELLAGESLAGYLGRLGGLPASAPFLELAAQIADALGAAHERGIYHRDLKPDNVFLVGAGAPAAIKVLDFGIAKLAKTYGAGRTRTGALMGTPLYMSPEQCRGSGTVDHRTDIYSLGCLLFEAWCGRPPFAYEGAGDLLVAHISEPAPDPRGWAPALSPELVGLTLACLAKDPAQRPQSMNEIAAALKHAAARAAREPLPPIAARDFSAEVPWEGRGDEAEGQPGGGPPAPSPGSTRESQGGALVGGTHRLPSAESSRRPAARPAPAPSDTTLHHTASERVVTGGRGGERPRSRRGLGLGLGALVLVAAGGSLAYRFIRQQPAAESSGTAAPDAPRPEAAGAPAPPSAPATVTIDVEGGPPGLTVQVDGRRAQVPVELARGEATHLFEFAAPGFAAQRFKLDARRSRVVTLAMLPAAAPPPVTSNGESRDEAEEKGNVSRERKPRRGTGKGTDKGAHRTTEPGTKPAQPEKAEPFHRFDDL